MSRAHGRASCASGRLGRAPGERQEGAASGQPLGVGLMPGVAEPGAREQARGASQALQRGRHPRPGLSTRESSASRRAAEGGERVTAAGLRTALSLPAPSRLLFLLTAALPAGRTLTRQGHAVTTRLPASACSATAGARRPPDTG